MAFHLTEQEAMTRVARDDAPERIKMAGGL